MRNYTITNGKSGGLKFLVITTCLFLFTNFLSGQNNTSYNANTIPIGGTYNTAFGYLTLFNTTGTYNVANGYQALLTNTTGFSNTANGHQALYSNTNGYNNTANGFHALYSNITGSYNTANGVDALYNNSTGNYNTANGAGALYSNTTGHNNTANGFEALYYNTTGYNNTAFGDSALHDNTTGIYNSAIGLQALHNNTTGNYNTANGVNTLYSNTTGDYNTSLGNSAGFSSLGSGNVFIGNKAGASETGSNKMYIGNDVSETLLYGDFSTGQILLGNSDPTGYAFIGTRTLNVLGGIIADSVRVALSGTWSDYVFNDNYQLKSLKELENFITKNKHLPNMPTAKEVDKEGIELGSMNVKLLEKIEELTLYILQQQKEIDELRKDVKKNNQ